ncbi:MAG: 30S ribosome-binding factor RbfA [Acidimicrobiales bacterium]
MPSGRHNRAHGAGGASPYPRALRVNEVLRQIVAEEIERLADADERLRLVTVTSVQTSADLRHATVYVGTLSEDAAESLEERRAQLQREVGRQVRMKRTPRLRFEADPAVSAGARVEEVLRRLRAPGTEGDPPERPGPAGGAEDHG